MTDGIIQEVFKTFIKNGVMNVQIGDIDLQVISVEVVKDLQQELMKKIKQEFNDLPMFHEMTLQKLIGDNE